MCAMDGGAQRFAADDPALPWVDPLPEVVVLTDRVRTLERLRTCLDAHPGALRIDPAWCNGLHTWWTARLMDTSYRAWWVCTSGLFAVPPTVVVPAGTSAEHALASVQALTRPLRTTVALLRATPSAHAP